MKWLRRRKEKLAVRPIEDEANLEEVLGTPRAVLYRHSPFCWASAMAMCHIRGFMEAHPEIPVFMVDVIANQSLSMDAADRLQVRHESPQAIAIVEGAVVWSGSHWEVTAEALVEAIVAV